ncbi:DDHD domain-containing protein, partial [Blakeslea trispora]
MGGIITWDILCHQIRQPHSKIDLEFPKLVFKPDYLFTLGSPLSAFLTVRNQDPKLYRPDPSIVFDNIFHPYDPLGYRFEPMLNSDYKHKPAVLIDESAPATPYLQDQLKQLWTKSLELIACVSRPFQQRYMQETQEKIEVNQADSYPDVRQYIHCPSSPAFEAYAEDDSIPTPKLSLDVSSEEEEEEEEEEEVDEKWMQVPVHYLPIDNNKKRRFDEPIDDVKKRKKDNDLLESTITRGIQHKDASIYQIRINKRIDYVLRPERFLGYMNKNSYLSGLTAHFSYWTHKDLMWHIVQRLNGKIQN